MCLAYFSIGNETKFYHFGIPLVSFQEGTYMAFIWICFVLVVYEQDSWYIAGILFNGNFQSKLFFISQVHMILISKLP